MAVLPAAASRILEGMSLRVAVTLSCDGGWSPDCHDTCMAEERSLLAAADAARNAMDAAGWVKRWAGRVQATVCPACAATPGYPQTVIGPQVIVTVLCDAWRAYGCHREYAAAGEHRPVTGDHVQVEAGTAGWPREFVPNELFTMDVCPACTGLKGAEGGAQDSRVFLHVLNRSPTPPEHQRGSRLEPLARAAGRETARAAIGPGDLSGTATGAG